ncbi:MAG: endonuclease/exonuclease/phosphatase family protein [Bacteroidota bacterium]
MSSVLRTVFHLLGNGLALLTAFGLLARFVPPDVLWPPAIVALLLPGLLLVTLLYALLVLYRRRWRAAVLPVLTILVAVPISGRLFSLKAGGGAAAGAGERIRIATLNARGFKDAKARPVSDAKVTKLIVDLDADVLLLQEAATSHGNSARVPLVKTAGAYPAVLHPRNRAVASLADNLEEVAVSLKGYNGFTVMDVTTALGKIRFINAHLQSNRISGMAGQIGQDDTVQEELDRAESMFRSYGAAARTRARQAEDIRKYIEQSPHPVVLGGDFNDVPSSYTYQRLRTPRLRDAWVDRGFGLGTTFTGPLPGLRIDYLLVDTSLTVVDVERIETGFSDHRGLRVVLE